MRRAAHSKSARKQAKSAQRGFSRELGVIGMFKKVGLAIGAIGLAIGLAGQGTPAQAQSGVRVGTLNCNVASGWGFVFGSSRALRCVFSQGPVVLPSATPGSISKFGVDIGYTQGGVLVWAVLAPTTNLAPGALAGNFGGATANATVGVGVGANVLIGGSNRSISLQPLRSKAIPGSTSRLASARSPCTTSAEAVSGNARGRGNGLFRRLLLEEVP